MKKDFLNSLNDEELSKLTRDQLFLYIILRTSEYMNFKGISYTMIKRIYHRKITNTEIDDLLKSLIRKKIIKSNKFILLNGDSK